MHCDHRQKYCDHGRIKHLVDPTHLSFVGPVSKYSDAAKNPTVCDVY